MRIIAILLGLFLAFSPTANPKLSEADRITFVEVAPAKSGITWIHDNGRSEERWLPETCGGGGVFLDYDNDGWLDFYCGTGDPDFRMLIPNRMFRNEGGAFFQDVTSATGTGHIQKGHGVAFADLDDDGCQDVYVSMGGAYTGDFAQNALFANPGSTNRFLKLKLVGKKANRVAIGARIKVTVQNPRGTRELHRVVGSGGSFGSNPLRQEIGLGDAETITSVEIRWPGSDTRQRLTGFELNRSYQIMEGDNNIVQLKLHPVSLRRESAVGKQAKSE